MSELTNEQIQEFKKLESDCEVFSEYFDLAQDLFYAGDKKWSRETFKKAEKNIQNFDDCLDLIKAVTDDDYLGDSDWGKNLIEKAMKFSETSASPSLHLMELGMIVFNDYYFGDSKMAKDIFLKAISCVESEALYESSLCYPLMELADVFISEENNGYGDKILGRKIYDLALEKSRLESFSDTCPFISSDTFFPLRDYGLRVANKEGLNDTKLAVKVLIESIKIAEKDEYANIKKNIYDVVEDLLGKDFCNELKKENEAQS